MPIGPQNRSQEVNLFTTYPNSTTRTTVTKTTVREFDKDERCVKETTTEVTETTYPTQGAYYTQPLIRNATATTYGSSTASLDHTA